MRQYEIPSRRPVLPRARAERFVLQQGADVYKWIVWDKDLNESVAICTALFDARLIYEALNHVMRQEHRRKKR